MYSFANQTKPQITAGIVFQTQLIIMKIPLVFGKGAVVLTKFLSSQCTVPGYSRPLSICIISC